VAFADAVFVGSICALTEERSMPKKQSWAQKSNARDNRMIFTLPILVQARVIARIYTIDRDLANRTSTGTAQ